MMVNKMAALIMSMAESTRCTRGDAFPIYSSHSTFTVNSASRAHYLANYKYTTTQCSKVS